jgi:hypothetical protein
LASASKRVFGNRRRREQSVRSQGGGFAIHLAAADVPGSGAKALISWSRTTRNRSNGTRLPPFNAPDQQKYFTYK